MVNKKSNSNNNIMEKYVHFFDWDIEGKCCKAKSKTIICRR